MLDMEKEKPEKMESVPPIPLDRRYSTAVASDSTIYVLGGVGGRGPDPLQPYHDDVYCLDTTTLGSDSTQWIALSPMLDGVVKPWAVAVDGNIFLYNNTGSQVFDGAKWTRLQGPPEDPILFSYLPPALADPSNHRILCCIGLEPGHSVSACSLHAYSTNEEDKTKRWKCMDPRFCGHDVIWSTETVIADNVVFFQHDSEFYAYDLDEHKWSTVIWSNEEPDKELFNDWNWEWEILVYLGASTLCLLRNRPFILDGKAVLIVQCLTFKVEKKGDATISASEPSLKQFTVGGTVAVEDYLVL